MVWLRWTGWSTDKGASWEDDIRLAVDGGVSASPSIAVRGSNIYVSWHDNGAGNYETYLWRIDDIARDVGQLTLDDQVWETVEHYCDSVGAELGLAEKHLVVACPYCGVGNPVGEGKCSACGGSLAQVQPVACPKCGFVLPKGSRFCSRCGTKLRSE